MFNRSFLLFTILFVASVLYSSPIPTSPLSPFPSAQENRAQATTTSDNTPRVSVATSSPKSAPVKKATREAPAQLPKTPPRAETVPEPPPALPPAATVQPSASSSLSFVAALEAKVLDISNDERLKMGLTPLEYDEQLSILSRAHSSDMIARDYFSHNDPDGCGSSCRANAAQYAWRAIGENIYMSSGYDFDVEVIARMVVDGWMSSPGHRANILGTQYAKSGIGVSTEGESVYVTGMYSLPRE